MYRSRVIPPIREGIIVKAASDQVVCTYGVTHIMSIDRSLALWPPRTYVRTASRRLLAFDCGQVVYV